MRRDVGREAKATISDVARLAGVSAATVSRVFNNTSSVSPDKEQRVRRAVAELDYQPFGPAQALRRQQVRVWAVVIADIENPFFTSVVRGIEDLAYAHGYRLVLCNSDEDIAKEAGYIDIAIRERMSGVVIAVASTSESHLDRLTREGIPVVAIDRRSDDGGIDTVLVDNVRGGHDATAHLLAGGYRRVGCVLGPSRLSTSNERLVGYRAALKDAGVRFDRSLVRRADFREAGGYTATRALMEATDPPDALFIANNLMTLGALHAIQDLGLRVPDDIGVVGFDDSPAADLMRPRLSVVAQPTHEIGRVAGELLLDASSRHEPHDTVLAPTLIVRDSSVPRRLTQSASPARS
jgi:LacI family transcriptional regulator